MKFDQGVQISYIHHGLFSPDSYMRPWTTVYTSWFLHTNLIHETIDHSVNSTSWSLLTNSIYETMDHSSLVSCMELVRRDHGVVYKDRVVHGLMHIRFIHETMDHSVYTSWFLHTNLIHETIYHSVNSTSWSLLTNSIYETMDHSLSTTPWSLHTNSIHETIDVWN
jgi:hypothetical protein